MAIDFGKFLGTADTGIANSQTPDQQAKTGIDMTKFLPSIKTAPAPVIPATFDRMVEENGVPVTKKVTVGGGTISQGGDNTDNRSFVQKVTDAYNLPAVTPADKLGSVASSVLGENKLPTGFDWIRRVAKAGYESVTGSVNSAAQGMDKIINNLDSSGVPLSAHYTQPGYTSKLPNGQDNPNFTQDLKSNTDYLKANIKNPLQRGTAMAEGVVQLGSLYFTQTMAELSAAKELPGPLSWPAKGVDWAFQKVGQAGSFIADKGVDYLPVSEDTKQTIRPLADQLGAFLAQMVGVHLAHGVAAKGLGGETGDSIPVAGEFKENGQKYVITDSGDVLTKEDYAKRTGQTGVYKYLPFSEKTKGMVSTGAALATGLAVNPFSTAFNLANAKIYTKIAERKANGIDVTPEEGTKIINEVKAEIPKELGLNDVPQKTQEKPIPFTPKEIADQVTSKLTNGTISGTDAEKLLSKNFTPEETAKILKDLPETVKDHVGVYNTDDLKRKIELVGVMSEREGTPLSYGAKTVPTNPSGIDVSKFITKMQAPAETAPADQAPGQPGQPTQTSGKETVEKPGATGKEKQTVEVPKETNQTSGLAKSIEAKAIEAKLTKGFSDLAEYQGTTIKEQAKLTSDLIEKDINKAREIVRGEAPLPDNMRGSALVVAMEEYLKAHPNADMAYELANSPLVSKASQAGSEISLLQNREQDSATAKLQELRQAKEKAVDEKVVKEARKTAKAETEKINLSKEDLKWDNFLEKIKC